MAECALREGWDWFNNNEVQRVDCPEDGGDPLFESDDAAVDHIKRCAVCAHDLLKLAVPIQFGPPPQPTYEVEVVGSTHIYSTNLADDANDCHAHTVNWRERALAAAEDAYREGHDDGQCIIKCDCTFCNTPATEQWANSDTRKKWAKEASQ